MSEQFEWVDPKRFLSGKRFDLMAKYLYVYYKEFQIDSTFGTDIYSASIQCMNDFSEPNNSDKNGKQAFLMAFDHIIENIKNHGFNSEISVIPVNNHYELLNGAHRCAASLFYDKKVPIEKRPSKAEYYDYKFFRSRGLDTSYLDSMANQYCELYSETKFALLFPSANMYIKKCEDILEEYTEIIYKKEIPMSLTGIVNLMPVLYGKEQWMGDWNNRYKGAIDKAVPCFGEGGNLSAYLVHEKKKDGLTDAKKIIRSICKNDNHSIHTSDYRNETLAIAQALLNQNSIKMLNIIDKERIPTSFLALLQNYGQILKENNKPDSFCVGGSSIMGLLGLRAPNDIDYLTTTASLSKMEFISNHSEALKYYPKTLDDMLHNPENYFYFEGWKFLDPSIIIDMKRKRGEKKDILDLELLDKTLKGQRSSYNILYSIKVNYLYRWKAITKRRIIKLMRKTGTLKLKEYYNRYYRDRKIEKK